MASKQEIHDRAKRLAKIIELIDEHGSLSCADMSVLMGVTPRTCAATMRHSVETGTHVRVATGDRDKNCNLVMVYQRSEYTSPPIVKKEPRISAVERVRRIIRNTGKQDEITSEWVSGATGLAISQAIAALIFLQGKGELVLSRQAISGGKKRNYYSAASLIYLTSEDRADLERHASLNLHQAMAGWTASNERFFSIRSAA